MEQSTLTIKDSSANPAPLGLFGFGMTTVLLNLHNAGIYEMNSMILAMGICYGGIAQIIAGIMESKKNNTFGMTAFISYGFFWLSLVVLLVMPKLGWVAAGIRKRDDRLSYYVGHIYSAAFLWHVKDQQSIADCIWHTDHFVFLLAAGDATGNAD